MQTLSFVVQGATLVVYYHEHEHGPLIFGLDKYEITIFHKAVGMDRLINLRPIDMEKILNITSW